MCKKENNIDTQESTDIETCVLKDDNNNFHKVKMCVLSVKNIERLKKIVEELNSLIEKMNL